MSLRFVWHILRKDAQRLRWMIALTVALLCRIVHFDSLRANSAPGAEEGWLNILLPLAWSFMIALASMEDPVLGEAPFWATVPCKWPSLLAAKAAFIAVFIHVPYFIGCVMILQARGFAPVHFLSDLFFRQFALLTLTLSSLALAAIVRNVTQFMMIAIVIATALGAPSLYGESALIQHLREILAFPTVVIAAVWIATSQYASRRTVTPRTIGVAALLIAGAFWWSPRERLYGLEAAMSPAPATAAQPSIRVSKPTGAPERNAMGPDTLEVAIPIAVSGPTPNNQARIIQGTLTLQDADGHSYSGHSNKNTSATGPVVASLCCEREFPAWQILAIEKDLYNRTRNLPVRLKGEALAQYFRRPDPVWSSVGTNGPVPDLGRCSGEILSQGNPNDEMLHVDCESPHILPDVGIRLTDPATGRNWDRDLQSASLFASHPSGTWLSPIHRGGTFFPLTDTEHEVPGGTKWQVPREVIDSVRIGITPEIPEGFSIVSYEIPDINLSQYRVKP